MHWKHWLRWLFSAGYRHEVTWNKNRYRWLVERHGLSLGEGKEINVLYIKALTSKESSEL